MKRKAVIAFAKVVFAIAIVWALWTLTPWYKLIVMLSAFSVSELHPFWYYSAIIIFVLMIIGLIWWVLQVIPKRQAQAVYKPESPIVMGERKVSIEGFTHTPQSVTKPSELFSIENEARKTLSQIIGGFVVIIGLFVTGANLIINQREAEKNRSLALEGQITDRFTKAISQLGEKEKLELRLGGIYALERIARDSEKDHWTIMEVLTAYIRENASLKKQKLKQVIAAERSSSKGEDTIVNPATDIQGILTVIGRRERRQETSKLNLSYTFLRGANFNNANLEGAVITEANLERAHLFRANLHNANLINTNFYKADFTNALLRRAFINQANLEKSLLLGADITDASLAGASLRGADITGADFTGANLQNIDLRDVVIGDFLYREEESEVRFGHLLLNLKMEETRGWIPSQLLRTKLDKADLTKANLRGVDLHNVTGLTWEQLSNAYIDKSTKLPAEIENKHKDELKAIREMRKERESKK